MTVDGVFRCWTLEDTDRGLTQTTSVVQIYAVKVPGRTAIPTGSYRVIVDMSSKFQKLMPRVCDVPGFLGIRIHAGRVAGHTEGCILVGMSHGVNEIFNPRQAYGLLFPDIESAYKRGDKIRINIIGQRAPISIAADPAPADNTKGST